MEGHRLRFETKCNMDYDTILKNVKKSLKYPRVTWEVLTKPPCAIVGGGSSVSKYLEELRNFPGDIYGINDTAGYLSDNGIPCYLFAIDATRYPFKVGKLCKGAVLASRVHRHQFNLFDKKNIRVFDMAEESKIGVQGGPTAVCRTPHLMLRMGHKAVVFYGIDSCFYDKTHVDGTHNDAFMNLLVVRVNGIDYVSNAALVIQAEFMANSINKHPQLLFNRSDGMIAAMVDNPNDWGIVAISDDLKAQYERAGVKHWRNEYHMREHTIWQPQAI